MLPFEIWRLIPQSEHWCVFLLLLILNLITMKIIAGLDQPLKNASSKKYGIVSFELAWSESKTVKILSKWKEAKVLDKAFQSLYIDFVFLVLYPLGLSIWCYTLSKSWPDKGMQDFGLLMSNLVLLALPLDALEDLVLLHILKLDDKSIQHWPKLATIFAVPKFALAIPATLYVLVSILYLPFHS